MGTLPFNLRSTGLVPIFFVPIPAWTLPYGNEGVNINEHGLGYLPPRHLHMGKPIKYRCKFNLTGQKGLVKSYSLRP